VPTGHCYARAVHKLVLTRGRGAAFRPQVVPAGRERHHWQALGWPLALVSPRLLDTDHALRFVDTIPGLCAPGRGIIVPARHQLPAGRSLQVIAMTSTSPQAVWETALGQLELQVTRSNYDTWLRGTLGLRFDDGVFVVGAASDFATEWLRSRLRPLIAKTLAGIVGFQVSVTFEVLGASTPGHTLPSSPQSDKPTRGADTSSLFHPRFTFSSFVPGEENRLARAAAQAVAGGPEPSYNPLVLYGPPGIGKTHLLHAIGHAALSEGRQPVLASAERFVNDFVTSLQTRSVGAFRARYRYCDVLLLDDLQFLEGKPQTQDEFFHTFNDLHTAEKQIVVSCDRPPSQLCGLAERLRSRLHWGLLAELRPPGRETRLAILRAKASVLRVDLPSDILDLIVHTAAESIRDLEGGLNRVVALATLTRVPISTELASRALEPFASRPHQPPTPQGVIAQVCQHFNIQPQDLTGPSRKRHTSYTRHVVMYLLRHESQQSLHQIGSLLGGRDHSSVLQGCRRIEREITSLPQTQRDIEALRSSLYRQAS